MEENSPFPGEAGSVVSSVLAATIYAVMSRVGGSTFWDLSSLVLWPESVCNSSLGPGCPVPQHFRPSWGFVPCAFNTFLLCSQSVSVAYSKQTRKAEIQTHKGLHSPQSLAHHFTKRGGGGTEGSNFMLKSRLWNSALMHENTYLGLKVD